MASVRAIVEYDGSAFCGFQYQPAMRSVAGELERALRKVMGASIKVTGAGRTDAGVHACGQVVSFAAAGTVPIERLAVAANAELAADVSMRHAELVDDRFSARASAIERAYVYAVLNRRQRCALSARYAAHLWSEIDLASCRAAAEDLLGTHDFRSFCGMLPDAGPTTRTVRRLEITRTGEFVRIEIAADGFLHRMVRSIVGTLLECGRGRRDPRSLRAVLAARNRSAAGATAPAHGLYLAGIKYPDGFDSFAEPPVFGGRVDAWTRAPI